VFCATPFSCWGGECFVIVKIISSKLTLYTLSRFCQEVAGRLVADGVEAFRVCLLSTFMSRIIF